MSPDFSSLFSKEVAENVKTQIENKVNRYAQLLLDRVMSEVPSLPIAS